MYFNLRTGYNVEEGIEPCAHFADGNLWFNIDVGQVAVHFSSYEFLQQFCSFLDKSKDDKDYLEYFTKEFNLLALEEGEETRNLCIYAGNVSLVFNLKTDVILKLSNYLRSQPKEDNFE